MDGGDEADACHTTRVLHRMFTNLDALRGHLLSLFLIYTQTNVGVRDATQNGKSCILIMNLFRVQGGHNKL